MPPRIALQLDEQRAVIDFAGRLNQLSEERSQELAAIIAPLAARPRGDAVASLVGVANWLLGKQS
jgi:3-deoxy-D-arabino-heptulosonate 7-phosphate (DAHP) synthase